jgi:hypothetical protein
VSVRSVSNTMRHVITVLAVITLPIWFLPFLLGSLIFLLYSIAYDAIWNHPKGGGGDGIV